MKALLKISCLWFLAFILVGHGKAYSQNLPNKQDLPVLQDTANGYAPVSSATLVFKEGKKSKVMLNYHDYLNNFIDIKPALENYDRLKVTFRNFLVITHSAKDNVPFIVLPNDRILLSLDSAGRLVLETHSPMRNAELNLFKEMSTITKIGFGLFLLTPVLKEEGYAKRDSLLDQRHAKRLAFMQEYSASPLIRPEMARLSEQYLLHYSQFEKYMIVINRRGKEEELKTYYAQLSTYLQSQNRFSYYFQYFRIIASSSVMNGFVAASAIKGRPKGTAPEKAFKDNLALVETFFDSSLVEPVKFLLINNPLNRKLGNNKEHLLSYASRYPTTDFTGHLKSELAYIESINKHYEGNQLLGQKDVQISLEKLMTQKRGKVLYVDFWASWCVPCLEEMPKSLELQKKYKGMQVEFVYLSVDKAKTAWAKGQQRYPQVLQSVNSFLLVNEFNAPFAQGLRLHTIPRYILIDKTGKIVNTNAPRPSEPDLLAKELEELLR